MVQEDIIFDTNAWIQFLEGINKPRNIQLFKDFISPQYQIIFCEMIMREFLGVLHKALTDKEFAKKLSKEPFYYFKELILKIKEGKLIFKYLSNQKHTRDCEYYFRMAMMIIKENKLNDYCFRNKIEFHSEDLAILLSLRDSGYEKNIPLFSGDHELKKALNDKNINSILLKNNINVRMVEFDREK